MRNHLVLGSCLTTLVLLSASAVLVNCGGDDNSSSPTDAGTDATTIKDGSSDAKAPITDAQAPDANLGDGGEDAGPQVLMHLLNNLVPVQSPIQICLAGSATSDPGLADALDMNPQPATALAPNQISNVSVPSLTGKNVRVYVYYETSLTALGLTGQSCQQLLANSTLTAAPVADAGADAGDAGDAAAPADAGASGSGVLVQRLDFDVSDEIPASTFVDGGAYLIFPTGCPQSSNLTALGDPAYCGEPPHTPNFIGDFHVYAYQLAQGTPGAATAELQGVMGVQTVAYLVPYAPIPPISFGLGYTDGGADGGVIYDVPSADGGTALYFPTTNGPLTPGAQVPPVGTAAVIPVAIGSAVRAFPVSQVAAASGLTTADLSGSAFTIAFTGSSNLNPSLADGGTNPLAATVHLVRNDAK